MVQLIVLLEIGRECLFCSPDINISGKESMMSDVKNGQINCGGNAAAPLSKRQFRDEREDRISYLPEELITRLALKASNSNIKGASKLIELLSKIPHFSNLSLDGTTLEVFGPPPPDLARPATKAIELRISTLTVFRLKIHNFCQILILVYIIRSCPNLEDICIMLAIERVKSSTPEESTIDNYFASLDSKDMCLDQLQTVKIKGIQYSRFVQNFIKLLLASSPSLKVISLSCNTKITSLEDQLKIKRYLRKIHRLSLDAQVIWC
ncbi:hypothetical protein ACET3Z_018162 [Daucus carota]